MCCSPRRCVNDPSRLCGICSQAPTADGLSRIRAGEQAVLVPQDAHARLDAEAAGVQVRVVEVVQRRLRLFGAFEADKAELPGVAVAAGCSNDALLTM